MDFNAQHPRASGVSGNNLAGLPVQPKDIHPGGGKYPESSVIGKATVAGAATSDADILLSHRATTVDKKFDVYRITTADGKQVEGKLIFVATGMGEPKMTVGTLHTQGFLTSEVDKAKANPKYEPKFDTVDTRIARGKNLRCPLPKRRKPTWS